MRRFGIVLLGLFSALAASSPALAQQTAAQLIREAVAQRGIYSGVTYQNQETPVYVRGVEPWHGLQVSEAIALGGDSGTYLAVLRNTTATSYCVRMKSFETTHGVITGRMQGNVLVEPYQHTVLTAANATYINTSIGIAFWQPDHSRERICSDAAPAGLETWATDGQQNHFHGSRR